jgi:hypothetical protein
LAFREEIMVWAASYATTAGITIKAGKYANATLLATAADMLLIAQMVEGEINSSTNYNWSDAYTTLNDDIKGVLLSAGTSLGAIFVINYDTTGYSGLNAAQTMIDILRDDVERCKAILKERGSSLTAF